MKPPAHPLLPYIALGIGIAVLSLSALFVRWADAPGPVMALYRLGLAMLILTPFFQRNWKRRPQGGKLPRLGLVFAALGGLMTALDHTVWNISLGMTLAANATLLNNAAPLWVALAAWLLFRERLHGRFWVGLAFTLSGAGAVLGFDFLRHPSLGWGDVVALASSLFYAGYFLATQRGRQHLDTLSYVWMVGFFSTLTLLVINLLLGLPLTGYSSQTYLTFLAAALISQIGGYLAVGYALGHLPASIVSPTMIGQPVITALLAIPLLGESLHPAQMAGGLAVLSGIFLIHSSREQPKSGAIPLPAD